MEKYEAIILKSVKLNEKNVLLVVLTPAGIKTIYGRGYSSIKSKYHILSNPGLKILMYGTTNNKYFNLHDFDLIEDNIDLIDYDKYFIFAQIVRLMTYYQEEYDDTTYQLLAKSIDFLKNNTENLEIVIDLWKLHLLQLQNYQLNLKCCGKCQSTQNIITFSTETLSLICVNCYQNEQVIDKEIIIYMYKLLNGNIEKIKKNKKASLFLDNLVETYTGYTIKEKNGK